MKIPAKKEESEHQEIIIPAIEPEIVAATDPYQAQKIAASEKGVATRKRKKAEIDNIQKEILELDIALRKAFPPSQIQKLIDDLCKASDIKMTAKGLEFTSPNWEARAKGLAVLMQQLRYLQGIESELGDKPVTKIVFQVIQNNKVVNEAPAG